MTGAPDEGAAPERAYPRPAPALPRDAHKGDAGRVLCIVGSRTMPGAAILVARAAQRAGAGLVQVGCLDAALLAIVPAAAPEAVLVDLSEVVPAWGRPGPEAEERLAGRAPHARLFGCGVGDDERARAVLGALLRAGGAPLVLDADALNALDGRPERLREARAPLVLTPHPGEAARLLCREVPRDEAGRLAAARELARRSGAIVLLKGHGTLVTDGERVHENRTGNPGMATAGAGDVLAGVLVAYVAAFRPRGAPAPPGASWIFDATALAAHVHGLAGDLAAAELGRRGLVASDLVRFLPAAQRLCDGEGAATSFP